MKNLTRKLFLSICTLAICAVTLVSTTFAWYTSNKEVTTLNDLAAQSSASTGSTLMVSQDLEDGNGYGDYKNFIDFTYITSNADLKLTPVQFKPNTAVGGVFNGELGVGDVTANKDYIRIKLSFKTTSTDNKDIPVYFKSFTMTSSNAKPYDNLLWNGTTVHGLEQATYKVDILNALDMVVVANGKNTVYELDQYATQTHGVGTPDAIGYYNTIMQPTKSVVDEESDETSTVLSPISAPTYQENEYYAKAVGTQTKPVVNYDDAVFTIKYDAVNGKYLETEVIIYFYLNGWDQYCYDACRNQNITFNVSFETR